MAHARVGQYLITTTLGEGTFGKVKLARHVDNASEHAIKILDKSDIRANELTTNVRREIAIMKTLNHKNIVRLHEVLSSKSKLYIVMELVRGGELFDQILRRGELDQRIARTYFRQLIDGIDYCHSAGVYHRDLKPENLLVDPDGTLKITDFGVSTMKTDGAAATDLLFTACGTPYYCAPEILNGAKHGYSGAKVDIWSCGIILFLLLVGSLPFPHTDMTVLYDKIQNAEVPYPDWLSADARDLVEGLLRKDPARRFSIDDIRQHPWFRPEPERVNLRVDRRASLSPNLHAPSREAPDAVPDVGLGMTENHAVYNHTGSTRIPNDRGYQNRSPHMRSPNNRSPDNLLQTVVLPAFERMEDPVVPVGTETVSPQHFSPKAAVAKREDAVPQRLSPLTPERRRARDRPENPYESFAPRVDSASILAFFRQHRKLHTTWLAELRGMAEPSGNEHGTTRFIEETLRTYSPSLVIHRPLDIAPTTLSARHDGAGDAPAVLLRAAQNGQGGMVECAHTAGHDIQTAALLAVAHWLHFHSGGVRRRAVLLFQPGDAGDEAVKAGLLTRVHNDVGTVFGLRVGGSGDADLAVFRGADAWARMEVKMRGGRGAVRAACSFVTAGAGAGLEFEADGVERVRDGAIVRGTTRAKDEDTRDEHISRMRALADGVAVSQGMSADVKVQTACGSVQTAAGGKATARSAAMRAIGGKSGRVRDGTAAEAAIAAAETGDDFAVLLQRCDGAVVAIGNGVSEGVVTDGHGEAGDAAVLTGARLFAELVVGGGER